MNIPFGVSFLFILTTFLTVFFFYTAAGKSKKILIIILTMMLIQAVAGLSGFFFDTHALPPRFLLLIGPGLMIILLLFFSKKGRAFIDNLDIQKLTLLHIIRIPVEITLFLVYTAGLVPMIMTFEGNNFDILSGISAPVIYYLMFIKNKMRKPALLTWNFICLGLLLNILIIAILSAQTPFQKLSFDQPNIGINYFPIVWLPGIVVPLVLFSHLSAIRQLSRQIFKSYLISKVVQKSDQTMA